MNCMPAGSFLAQTYSETNCRRRHEKTQKHKLVGATDANGSNHGLVRLQQKQHSRPGLQESTPFGNERQLQIFF